MIAAAVLRWVFAIAVCCIPTIAWAEAKVVLRVVGADAEPMQARVARELELRGFVVATHDAAAVGDPVDDIAARARSEGAALGALVVLETGGGARIDVVDRVTGKRLSRTLPAEDAGHGRSTIALAVAELVDASLVELRLASRTAVGEIEPPDDLPVPVLAGPRIAGQVGASVGMLWPVRHAVPVAVVTAEVGVRPTRRVAVLADGTLPLFALRRELELAEIRTYPFLVGVRTDVDILPRRSAVRMDLQAGLTALALRVEVDARPGAWADPKTDWSAAAIVGTRVHGTIGRRVSLGGSVRVVLPFDDVRIRFDAAPVQRLGPPWVGLGVGVAVRL